MTRAVPYDTIVAYLAQRGGLSSGAAAPVAPTNTVAPVVSGTATVGQTLTCTTGTWTGDATIVFTYQWQRDGVNIGGATASTYLLVDADYTKAVRCRVTGTNGAGNATANSNATAAVAYNPAAITGLQFWLDAADAASFTFSSGVLVSQWNDKSGNARHITQATTGQQPSRNGTLNSRTTVVFSRARGDLLASASGLGLSQPLSMFIVLKQSATATDVEPIGFASGCTVYASSGGDKFGLYGGSVLEGSTASDTAAHDLMCEFNGGSSKVWLDGTTIGSGAGGALGWAQAAIGNNLAGSTGLTGMIAEILVYDSVLSNGNRQSIESYLRTKWGTP